MLDEAVPSRSTAEAAWSLAASFLLHGLLALAILRAWTAPPPPPPVAESIPVTLLTPAQLEALLQPARPQGVGRQAPAEPPPEALPPLMHAATILSGQALAEPRNRQALADLPKLNAVERMIQLCNIEALEQVARVRHDFAPEIVSAYATRGVVIAADTVEAAGAAVRSGDAWYALRYRCRLAPDHAAVAAFDFLAGDRLSPERVDELGLPVGN